MKFLKSRFFIVCLCVAVIIVLVPAVLAAMKALDAFYAANKEMAEAEEKSEEYLKNEATLVEALDSAKEALNLKLKALRDCTETFVVLEAKVNALYGEMDSIIASLEDSVELVTNTALYDDNQENYKTGMMDNYNVITMPFTCPDKEMASIITEAMNYYSREYVYPAYYEESLQKQAVQDPESVEMLDIIMEGRTFDLGTIFSPSLAGLSMCFRSAVSNNTTDFATFFATIEERVSIGISDLIASYEVNKQN